MYDQRFFASKLGHAALVSIAAMITFALLTTMQGAAPADVMLVGMAGMDLA